MAETKEIKTETTTTQDSQIVDDDIQGQVHEIVDRIGKDADVGLALFEKSFQYDPAQLQRDSVKVRRKLDFLVLPLMMVTYMWSFLDKSTLNYSNSYGLQKDLNITGDQYSWIASALYFGWLAAAWPWNILIQKYPVGRLAGYVLVVWGVLCMLQGAVYNFAGFVVIRFFLGAVEAMVSPAWVILTSMLYTREEQPLRTSFWLGMNGVSIVIGALLSYGLGHASGLAVPNWKLIYLVVGALTTAWAVVIILYLPDGPHNAKCLNEYERVVAVWRVSHNNSGVKHSKFLAYQVKEALWDSKTWILMVQAAAFGILNGGVSSFQTAIIKGFGFSALKTSLYTTPAGALEVVGVLFFGWLSTKKNCMGLALMLSVIPGIGGLAGMMTLPVTHRYNLLACAWCQNIVGSPIILSWTLPATNVAGHTKRATVLGLYFIFFCGGSIAGPHLFFEQEAPRYPSALKGMMVCYAVGFGTQAVYTAFVYAQNKARDKKQLHTQVEREALEGFEDLTDMENLHFRYRV
ncbi:hypothetical protein A1O1_05693 [Capronia coronata CBS 617.96]|uniref:Major facilitator superfamily (MFS) profile domain-containing protein n=1 Tax=Capronia coronata CBS 617.96 TaxID=1182541 RepID=W9YSU4_9EURO|nr:uncharacterized protein A1O1_05693 [Capronia coronata CBS 617.96]EXJ85329.1 hypothetical protein A1O1_05693 [Capronia coronata CBS 617.96]